MSVKRGNDNIVIRTGTTKITASRSLVRCGHSWRYAGQSSENTGSAGGTDFSSMIKTLYRCEWCGDTRED